MAQCCVGNPMNFTMEYMEGKMISVIKMVLLTLQGEDYRFFRNDGGIYFTTNK
jgi:hypothetical protein